MADPRSPTPLSTAFSISATADDSGPPIPSGICPCKRRQLGPATRTTASAGRSALRTVPVRRHRVTAALGPTGATSASSSHGCEASARVPVPPPVGERGGECPRPVHGLPSFFGSTAVDPARLPSTVAARSRANARAGIARRRRARSAPFHPGLAISATASTAAPDGGLSVEQDTRVLSRASPRPCSGPAPATPSVPARLVRPSERRVVQCARSPRRGAAAPRQVSSIASPPRRRQGGRTAPGAAPHTRRSRATHRGCGTVHRIARPGSPSGSPYPFARCRVALFPVARDSLAADDPLLRIPFPGAPPARQDHVQDVLEGCQAAAVSSSRFRRTRLKPRPSYPPDHRCGRWLLTTASRTPLGEPLKSCSRGRSPLLGDTRGQPGELGDEYSLRIASR